MCKLYTHYSSKNVTTEKKIVASKDYYLVQNTKMQSFAFPPEMTDM